MASRPGGRSNPLTHPRLGFLLPALLLGSLSFPGHFEGELPLAHLPRDVPIPEDPLARDEPLDLSSALRAWGPFFRAYQVLSLRDQTPTLIEVRIRALARISDRDLGVPHPGRQLALWDRLSPAERRLRLIEARRVQTTYESRIDLGGRATRVMRRYLAYCERLGDQAGIARMLRYLGDMEELRGNGSRALDLWEEAYLAIKETGWPPGIVDYQGKLAVGYARRGLYSQARGLLLEATRLAESFGSLVFQARMLGRLGTIDLDEGNLEEARRRYDAALELALEAGNQTLIHSQLNNVGALETRLGRFDEAYEAYARALREGLPAATGPFPTRRTTSNFYYRGQTMAGLGNMYLLAGRPRRAYLHLARALTQFRAIGELFEESRVLDTLADLDVGLGRFDEARRFTERSLEIKRSMRDDVGEARSLVRLGRIALAEGSPEEARHALEAAHQRALRFHDRFIFITSLLYMGESYRNEGRWAEAKRSLRDCANLAWENGLPVQEAMAKLSLARIYRDEEKEPLALSTLREAIDVIERFRDHYPIDSFLASIFGELNAAYGEMIALLIDEGAEPLTSLEYAEMARARTLLDILSGREIVHQILPDDAEIETALEGQALEGSGIEGAVEVAALLPFPEDPVPPMRGPSLGPGSWDYTFVGPPHEEEPEEPSLPPGVLRTLSDRGTVLVEYACLEDRLVVWLVADGELRTISLPVARREIELEVSRMLEAVSLAPAFLEAHPTWEERNRATRERLAALADRILHPLLPYLENAVEIVFLPDGPLYLVPYSALPTRRDGEEPLVSRATVRIAPSISTLGKLKGPGEANLFGEIVAVGYAGPFPRTRSSASPPDSLPRADDEARMVGRLAPGARTLIGPEANERNLRAALPRATLVHLASHAVVDRDQPLLSYVSLARDPGDDGLFTMQEVLETDLGGRPLVVLSACETALGRLLPGEGVLGLTQSFLAAGAQSVVSSLWAVSDEAAFEFMVEFYRSLRPRGGSPARALQLAQLRHLARHRRADDPLAHPYYWAAFAVTGG